MAHDNYGFQKVEILTGNVGYLDLRFLPPAFAAGDGDRRHEPARQRDALIIDLRHNGGGTPEIQLSAATSSTSPPTSTTSTSAKETRRAVLDLAYVPGRVWPPSPVFVLTPGPFSGGEEFAYNLKI